MPYQRIARGNNLTSRFSDVTLNATRVVERLLVEPMVEPRITLEQVRHVARLARFELSAEEETSLQANMSEILAYVDKLNELDTADVEPTTQVGEAGTPMRDDQVTNQPAPEDMLRNAPSRVDNFFKVPRIIE
jgi:aspartyl-tRNA(Asn)/glutamyl-tRNA(Gln) amidotransferase subunit C